MTDVYYIWQEQEPSGRWGTIAAVILPPLEATALVTRSREIADNQFAKLAKAHCQSSGRSVRLARFDFGRTLETYYPE